ncbi:MAG: filamentous hemagglutinin N-terminal domain-containing protein [Bradyrhizobium sp.]|nr:filamentous hemagglutinin N-terminal domain-containing protein [Bradyrhizobium sp.]
MHALLGGVSVLALFLGAGPVEAQRLQQTVGRGVVPTQAIQQAATQAAQQAAAAAQQSQSSMARAAAALAIMRQVQSAAAGLAGAGNVPNGITNGGLMPQGGVTATTSCGLFCTNYQLRTADPTLWQGADAPQQTVQGDKYTVDINQTQKKAILNWDSFSIGRNTTLNFNQQAPDWIAFNRINEASTAPSQILGNMNAIGSVYVINRNGIIFGGGSQVNVHTLIASDLDVGQFGLSRQDRDSYFQSTGIAGATDKLVFTNTFPVSKDANGTPGDKVGGGIFVQPGASITTNLLTPDTPGSIFLFGANVYNEGTLTSPGGQVALVAAQGITLTPNATKTALPTNVVVDSSTNAIRSTGFLLQRYGSQYGANGSTVPTTAYRAGTGSVVSGGLIETPRGTVTMNGDTISIGKLAAINIADLNALTTPDVAKTNVTLANLGIDGLVNPNAAVYGVISADTSISRNSMVLLDAVTSVDLQGVISVQPYENGETLPIGGGSSVAKFLPAFVEMSAQNTVSIASSGLISAPSATVSLLARANTPFSFNPGAIPGQFGSSVRQVILAGTNAADPVNQPGAVIDVAGLQNVELPASYNFIQFQPRGGEFADMPLQRNGPLFNQSMWIDIRASGTRTDGTSWVGTPLGDASGFIAGVGRSIKQLMTTGGSVSLTAEVSPALNQQVIQQSGSVINVAGGKETFLPGVVPATYLLGANGRIYSMDNADPMLQYVGIAGESTIDHLRWNLTETYGALNQSYQAGYVQGHDAGSVSISTATLQLGGKMYFGAVAGERQIASNDSKQIPSQGSLSLTTQTSVVIGQGSSLASTNAVTPGTAIHGQNFITQAPYQTILSADALSSYGLSSLTIKSSDLLLTRNAANNAAGLSDLRLAAGGAFGVTVGGAIDIAGQISASGGTVSLLTDRYKYNNEQPFPAAPKSLNGGAVIAADVYVEGTIDVSGRFVNDASGSAPLGSAFIKGGTISIATNSSSATSFLDGRGGDTTGSIILAPGSVLDVSSGGYIAPRGRASSSGVMAGAAGTIELKLYQGLAFITGTGTAPIAPASGSKVATVQLGGTLRAYGFENNGTLTIAGAQTFRIGGTPSAGDGIYLPVCSVNCQAQATTLAGLIGGGGFGAYNFSSVLTGAPQYGSGDLVVSAGANLVLQQQNLSSGVDYSSLPTGTRIGAVASLTPGLGIDQRKPVNLTLSANNSILLDKGSRIETDPGASITLTGGASASSVLINGAIVDHGGTMTVAASHIWLGSQASIDLSGTSIASSTFGLRTATGLSAKLLSGGMLVMDSGLDNNWGGTFVVAEQGAKVDVSGYAGTVAVKRADRSILTLDAWSDAGTVAINSGAFVWGGTFVGLGGRSPATGAADPRANGGTLMLGGGSAVSTDVGVVLTNDSANVISALSGASKPTSAASLTTLANVGLGQFAGKVMVGVDKITGSAAAPTGFENIYLYAGTANNGPIYSSVSGAARIFTDLSTTLNGTPINTYGIRAPSLSSLTIQGSLDWRVASRLHIAASQINAGASTGSSVSIQAPYVELTGGGSTASALPGNNSLTIAGQTIDIEGAAFSGFGVAIGTNPIRFIASGDIRLSTPRVANNLIQSGSTAATDPFAFSGTLAAGGDLLLQAQRIYPVSAVDFTIKSAFGNVAFASPQGSRTDLPLSAGGSITVSAVNITQGGNLFAPLGKITLGVAGTTQTVSLEPGSLTSVTLAGTTVAFGETQDGVSWYYNSVANPLAQPPAKGIALVGNNVQTKSGSTIDLRGGGDLQAMEWIQGKGGTRDALTVTPTGQTVYALLPASYGSDPVSPFDIHFTTARATTAGDAYPLAGTQIYLDGGNGIPAGTYTLLPAHYATLPGALKVAYYGSNLVDGTPSGTTLPDGTVLVTGHYTQSTRSQVQSFGQAMFAVQTGPVWKQYSEYNFSSANSYFIQNTAAGSPVPRLPMDAGRLAAVATNSLLLAATALTQPALDSNGKPLAYDSGGNLVDPSSSNVFRTATVGELDVSASQLAVVRVASDADPGHLAVTLDQLNQFGSVLIGGQRNDLGVITPTAIDIVFDTRGAAFTGPEIILATQATTAQQPGTITIRSGSIIDTTRSAATLSAGRSYSDATEGAIFVATNDSNLAITGPTTGSRGSVTIQGGTSIKTATLTMQATKTTAAVVLDKSAVLNVNQLNLAGATVGIGASVTDSIQLTTANQNQLAGVGNLALRAFSGDITFYKNAGESAVNFVQAGLQSLRLDGRAITGTGGDVNVQIGGRIILANSGTATGTSAVQGTTGKLTLAAQQIELGGGTQTIAGFGNADPALASVQLTASERVLVSGPGALTLGTGTDAINLNVTTPNILVGGKTVTGAGSFALTTSGTVTTQGTAKLASIDEVGKVGFGGNLVVNAKAITLGTALQAESGTVMLRATNGGITLGSGAYLAARGYAKQLFDQTRYSPGGKLTLQADNGAITAMGGSTIDVSQPAGGLGYGGELNLIASGTSGAINLGGRLLGGGGPGLGGRLKLDSQKAVDLNALAALIQTSGFTGAIDVRSRSGNMALSQGNTLTANTVVLTADDKSSGNGVLSIAGTIDASGYAGNTADGSGQAGGQVGLFAANAVTLTGTGKIVARTAHSDERGGDVTIGLGPTATGAIDLQAGSLIDVTGGTKGGLAGGTVLLRAPLIADASGVAGRGDVAITQIASDITGARAVTVQPYVTFSTNSSIDGVGLTVPGWDGNVDPGGAVAGTAGAAAHVTFFTSTLKDYVQGVWTFNGKSYGFGLGSDPGNVGTLNRLIKPLVAKLGPDGASIVHIQPGVDLVNPDSTINGGNITVASNWNLASGTAFNSNGTQLANGAAFDVNSNAVQFNYRLVSNYGTAAAPNWAVNAGALALRATNNINVNASISDGFFQFADYTDATYVTQVRTYLNSLAADQASANARRRGIDPLTTQGSFLSYLNSYLATPALRYKSAGNIASPTSLDLVGADLFPHTLIACTAACTGSNRVTLTDPSSWSYQLTAGANLASANPAAIKAQIAGDVVLKGTPATSPTSVPVFNSPTSVSVYLSTMVRTGTGNIGVFAAGDVKLSDLSAANTAAPGVIYAAGVQTPKLVDPGYAVSGTTVRPSYTGSDAFFEPRLMMYDTQAAGTGASTAALVFGPPTTAAFPYKGGDVTVTAQRDVIGVGDATATTGSGISGTTVSTYQLFAPWLMSMAGVTPVDSFANASQASLMGAGVFAPFGRNIATQTAWWIQYNNFQQGILSAGGNVSVTAGRNIVDVSVSLPTTGRVSGGLVSPSTGVLSTPVTNLYDSGNMSVQAGGNILGGAFYEGSGHAVILARGSVGSAGTLKLSSPLISGGQATTVPDLPLLAVDAGRISLTAAGSLAFAGVVNPAELHRQLGTFADPVAALGTFSVTQATLTMDTYGPQSGVDLVSLAGDVTVNPTPTYGRYGRTFGGQGNATLYPASLKVVALGGNIVTQGMAANLTFTGDNPGIHLSGSMNGAFELLAQGSVDLTGGYTSANRLASSVPTVPSFSAGPSLLDAAFDPYRPLNGFSGSFSRAVLAHGPTFDDEIARIYAVTGNITGVGTYMPSSTAFQFAGYRRLEINRPSVVRAGGNIVDLNLIVQNIGSAAVSTVMAGGDIRYTGWFNGGGIQVAGPGTLVVQAGGNLGPFLPLSHDTADLITGVQVQQGIVSVGNTSQTPVGNMSGSTNQLWFRNNTTGIYNTALLGPYAPLTKKRNELLPSTGADIIALFGVKYGIDYQSVIDAYIDPAVLSGVGHKYTDELQKFLARIGIATKDANDAWLTFRDVLPTLPQGKDLQHVFVDQVFFAELKAVGTEGSYAFNKPSFGYRMIETMFPAKWGYTENAQDGAGGARSLVHTGNLNILHATIQTQRGGNISLFGPGGSILVGSLASEPNDKILKQRDLGILTLGGGAINTFTDASLIVNSSRVLTVLGGDILAWSSNADLNAGRGSRTALSLPPLTVNFDSNDYQTIDAAGLVSGSGIGVLKSTVFSSTSNVYLFAPRGVIDAGDAGIRSSGSAFFIAPVILNQGSISVAGSSNLPSVQVPNFGAITSAANTAGSQSKPGDTATASGNRDQASVFIVEVIGYGGGDGGGGAQDEKKKEQAN